jgi:hypothetical protein
MIGAGWLGTSRLCAFGKKSDGKGRKKEVERIRRKD